MSPADSLRLILLSSLWGMSFLFMRVASPEFGPVSLVLVRMGVSALLWGYLLLDETLSLRTLVGLVITLAGTAIATRMIRWCRPQVA